MLLLQTKQARRTAIYSSRQKGDLYVTDQTVFNTRKRALTSSAVAVAILALAGTGTAFATETVARNTSIGSGNAQNFAFADAGVDPTSATGIRTEFDFEQGQFIYEVEFLANGTEYEYWIKASDGSIVKRAGSD